MRILTWNLLHRIHGENHSEPAIARRPDEAERVARIVARLQHALTAEGCDIALLQEVSGEMLDSLRSQLPGRTVLDHRYPRLPRRRGSRDGDVTASEHLVVVAPPGAKVLEAHTFANNAGKGFLAVTVLGSLRVVSTHVSWGASGLPQLARLDALLRAGTDATCIGGDFNAPRPAVSAALAHAPVLSLIPDDGPRTHPRGAGGNDIDHLLATRGMFSDVRVLDHGELSDHRPVAATWIVNAVSLRPETAPDRPRSD